MAGQSAGTRFEIGPGDVVYVPVGDVHYFINTDPQQEMETIWLYGGAGSLEASGYRPVNEKNKKMEIGKNRKKLMLAVTVLLVMVFALCVRSSGQAAGPAAESRLICCFRRRSEGSTATRQTDGKKLKFCFAVRTSQSLLWKKQE